MKTPPHFSAQDPKNGFDYYIDYDARLITTIYRNHETITPFNAAFATAIHCLHTIEDQGKKARQIQERVYLLAYASYLRNAPVYPDL